MISLETLKAILDKEFGEPFLPKDYVEAIFLDKNHLQVAIGRRDVTIDENGAVTGAGTSLMGD